MKNKCFWCVVWLLVFASTLVRGEPLVIRTLAQDGFTAKFNFENKAKPGIVIEIFRAIEKIDPGVKFVGYEVKASTARVEDSVVTGEVDTFFGLVKTPERTHKYQYVDTPLYTTRGILVARANDPVQIRGWDDIRVLGDAGGVLVARGTSHASHLKSLGGLSVDDQSATTVGNLRKLLAGRGRFFFASDINAAEEIRALKLDAQVKILPVNFWETQIYAVFSRKTHPAIVKRISDDLKMLEKTGELKKIYARYIMD